MNILFFLTPKSEVDYINEDATLFKTIRKMQERNYAAIPIVGKDGRYVGTITSGDILGYIKENFDLTLRDAADTPLANVRRVRDNKAVKADSKLEEIIDKILYQNFVPVVDDNEHFIGIITRSEVIKWLHKQYNDLRAARTQDDDK